jgi:hypothetical protein
VFCPILIISNSEYKCEKNVMSLNMHVLSILSPCWEQLSPTKTLIFII